MVKLSVSHMVLNFFSYLLNNNNKIYIFQIANNYLANISFPYNCILEFHSVTLASYVIAIAKHTFWISSYASRDVSSKRIQTGIL